MGWNPSSENLNGTDQTNLEALLAGLTDPLTSALVGQLQILYPSFPDPASPAQVALAALFGVLLEPPQASVILDPVTVPGDGTPTNLVAPAFFAAADVPVSIDAALVISSSTGNISGANVDTDPLADGDYPAGTVTGFEPATGLGTPTLAMSASGLLSWATLQAPALTAAVVTSDGQPATVVLAYKTQNCRTGFVVPAP